MPSWLDCLKLAQRSQISDFFNLAAAFAMQTRLVRLAMGRYGTDSKGAAEPADIFN